VSRPVEAIQRSRLYLVCEGAEDPEATSRLLGEALRGGVDLIQLRDKRASDDVLLAAAPAFREAADRHDALFLINDRPDLVDACGADGVHVGQDDVGVAPARRLAGPNALVGLSTHGPAQLRAANRAGGEDRPDYISVGPVWATPTKPGRPAAGLDYVGYASRKAELPWFAIGGIDAANVGEVAAAGAARIVVVRAIRDAGDPAAAATMLRAALGAERIGTDA
jgi:thiamine-phosphate pyrophosphorylase